MSSSNPVLIGVTERGTFRQCPRAWDIQAYGRQGLAPITPNRALHVGSAVHAALDANAKGKDWRDALDIYVRAHPTDAWESDVLHPNALAFGMVEHYFLRYGEDTPLRKLYYVDTEITLKVAIPGFDPVRVMHTGTLDGIAVPLHVNPAAARDYIKDGGTYYIVDHKSYERSPNYDSLLVHDQFIDYCWMCWQTFGHPPEAVIYDGLKKKLPAVPKMLKNGSLSREWVSTTAAVYRAALDELGLPHTEYHDLLARYDEAETREQTEFFTRFYLRYSNTMLRQFEKRLQVETEAMLLAHQLPHNDPHLYPNFNALVCPSCRVKDICHGIEKGDDLAWIIKHGYARAASHSTLRNQSLPPTSLEDWS